MTEPAPENPDVQPAWHLFVLGALILFWELTLIRWMGNCIRIVAYYSNFVLIAAFFGLGLGALLVRFPSLRLQRYTAFLIAFAILMAASLGGYYHYNPGAGQEFTWFGTPLGMRNGAFDGDGVVDVRVVLAGAYVLTAATFCCLGSWVGTLFKQHPPLLAYTLEIAGSLAGLVLFGVMSALATPPVAWFSVGYGLMWLLAGRKIQNHVMVLAPGLVAIAFAAPISDMFLWSPYYKIFAQALTTDPTAPGQTREAGAEPIGYTISVNNDYHQVLVDLRPRETESEFLKHQRATYDAPYNDLGALPDGPILVVGAGTGNDVAAALRNSDRQVDAVEIDPMILQLGRQLNFAHPYDSPRVHIINDDARAYFERAPENHYAMVIFGFLDSHTVLSSYSSLRLDNFVYTRESLERVYKLLKPGGRVSLSFAPVAFIIARLKAMLELVFPGPATYSNLAILFTHKPLSDVTGPRLEAPPEIPTDNWPFLYLRTRGIPEHYRFFLALVLLLGLVSLWVLPKGQRGVKLQYFWMGAGFFLLESSNVVSLSLLYGSTWKVNLLVFSGILVLILLANLLLLRSGLTVPVDAAFVGLLLALLLAWWVEPATLLGIQNDALKSVLAVLVFLSPVFFAALIFASLVRTETALSQAYGSNLLGALLGAAAEYLSLLVGFKALLLLAVAIYVAAWASSRWLGPAKTA